MHATDRYDSLIQWYAAYRREPGVGGVFHPREVPHDWHLLKTMIAAESAMNPEAVSPVGALGLAQAMPETWAEWAGRQKAMRNRLNPEHAIAFLSDYLAWLLERTHGDTRQAVAAYNAGIGRVGALVRRYGPDWERFVPSETAAYLVRILGNPPATA